MRSRSVSLSTAMLDGALLGAANVLVIACTVLVRDLATAAVVASWGATVGAAAGGSLGGLAWLIRERAPWLRWTLLAVGAECIVLFLWECVSGPHPPLPLELMTDAFAIASVSTLIAALALERRTRAKPRLPAALARSR